MAPRYCRLQAACARGCRFLGRVLFLLLFLRLGVNCHAVEVRRSRVDMIPVVIAPPSTHIEALSTEMGKLFGRVEAAAPIVPLSNLEETLVMDEGSVEAEFSFSFMAEMGRNMSDYSVAVECSNHAILRVEDVDIGPPMLMDNGRANYTLSVTFERQVGEVDLAIVFRKEDRSVYTGVSVHYIVCGMSFFSYDARTSKKTLLPNNEFLISTFHALLQEELLVFYVFLQFPDGSNSETSLRNPANVPKLSSMTTSVQGDKLIADHNFEACLTKHSQWTKNGTIALDASCSFGFTSLQTSKPLFFAIRLLRHRTGRVVFHFRWEDFLHKISLGELFETSLSIRVTGTAPASIISVSPPGPFRKSGGQLLECAVINAPQKYRFFLIIGNYTRTPIARRVSQTNSTVLSFVTPPGAGQSVPWDVMYAVGDSDERASCIWADDSDRYVFNYLVEEIVIRSISPAFGPVSGGTLVSFAGHFGEFNVTSKSGDAIMLGSYALEKKYIVSVTTTSLVFTIPPMQLIQSLSYGIECYVIVHGIRSNVVRYTYESLTHVAIEITGGSYEAINNTFLVPICGLRTAGLDQQSVALFANVNKGAALTSLRFEWHIVVLSTRTNVVQVAGSAEAQSLSVPLSKFSVHETYEAVVVTSDERYNTQLRHSIRLQPTKLKRLGVGLSLDHSRTISLPPVDTRVTATVTDLGECYEENATLSYDWTFMSVTKTLMSTSKSVDINQPSPRRLGQEYIIPRNKLVYGRHNVTVKVYYTADSDTFGTATTWLSVEPAPLQPMIGGGESLIRISSSDDLEMSAALSRDPDFDSTSGEDNMSFEWRCEMSVEGKEMFMSFVQCPASFVPSIDKEEFVISSNVLNSIQFTDGMAHLRYSLIVRKKYKKLGIRSSIRVSQIVEIVHSDEVYATRGSISLSGFDGRPVYGSRVPYYEGLIISVAGPVGSAWRFHLLEPAAESFSFLQNPNNLLVSPGFYRPNEFIAGRHALGIRASALQPDTGYKFEVEYESRDASRTTSVEVKIQTAPRATVTFLPLQQTSGTMDTVFSAMASPSMEYYEFKFYFYIRLSDGSEICIDGCSGQRKVLFKIPIAGNHTIRCAMVDSRGKFVIHEATRTQSILIYESSRNSSLLDLQSKALEKTFNLGDHSAFGIESLKLAVHAQRVDKKNEVAVELVADLVGETVRKLADMYRKTQPNTALAKDYALITKSFASIPEGSEAFANVATFYNLCRMLYFSVRNTPAWERYDMTSEVVSILGKLPIHARQIHKGGWSRRRLVAYRAAEVNEVNEALLTVNELVVPLLSTMLTRGEPCGHQAMANVSKVGTVRVRVGCNREQGLSIVGKHSRLEWCERVYSEEGQKRVAFTLAEFDDYIEESGVLSLRKKIGGAGEKVGSDGSVPVETGHMASQGYVIVKTGMENGNGGVEEAERVRKKCFRIVQDVRASSGIFGGDVECEDVSTIEYRNLKRLENKRAREGDYAENRLKSTEAGGRTNRKEDKQAALQVRAVLGRVNGRTFGVKRFHCRDLRPVVVGENKSWWVGVVGVCGILVIVGALGTVGVGWMTRREGDWVEGGDDGPYIDRDIYGRGLGLVDQRSLEVEEEAENGERENGERENGERENGEEEEGDDEVVFENVTPRHKPVAN